MKVLLAGSVGIAFGVLVDCLRKRRKKHRNLSRLQHGEVKVVAADVARFEEASAWVNKNGGDLSTSALLELYAFYKQATCGDCGGSQPMGFQAAAKWDAWSQLAGCPPDLARASYVQVLETYVPNWQFGGRVEERQSRGSGGGDVSMGPAVSTMGCIGGGDPGDVDETPAGQLCQQIAEGDVEGACGLLRASPQLAGQADKDGMLPLHWACDRGDLDMVQFLLELPAALAMINTADAAGDTALHYAVMSENESVAQLLVSKGADVTATNEAGETPSQLAEEGGLSLRAD